MPNSRMSRAAGKAKTKTAKNKAKSASKSGPEPARAARSKRRFRAMRAPPDAERYALALESINEIAVPAMSKHFAPLERSPEYFTWDPI